MLNLASVARPQLQAEVPEAQAENKNVAGRLETWIQEEGLYFPKGLINENPNPKCYYQPIFTDFSVLWNRVSSYMCTSLNNFLFPFNCPLSN